MKKELNLDLDDTLCSFSRAWVEWLQENNYTQDSILLSDVITYDWFYKEFGHSCTDFFLVDPHITYEQLIKPFPKSQEFMGWAQDNFSVKIVTSCNAKKTQDAKAEFCKTHFNIDESQMIFVTTLEDKYKYTKGSILVDDWVFHVMSHVGNQNGIGIVFDHNGGNGWSKLSRYNELKAKLKIKQHIPSVNSYDDLKKYLEGHI